MLKRYTFWLKFAIAAQIVTAVLHSGSFFVSPPTTNESEKELVDLMDNYKMDLGEGFHRSMGQLVMAFSITFAIFYLFGGVLNAYLLRRKIDTRLLKGVIGVSVIFYGGCFAAVTYLTFLPPIVCTGVVWVTLVLAYVTIPANKAVA